jgi:hypothetical protein
MAIRSAAASTRDGDGLGAGADRARPPSPKHRLEALSKSAVAPECSDAGDASKSHPWRLALDIPVS